MLAVLVFYSQGVFAASMTQKLWGGIDKGDVENLKEFSNAIKKDDYKKA